MSYLNPTPSNGNPFDLGVDGLLPADHYAPATPSAEGLDDAWALIPQQRTSDAGVVDLTDIGVDAHTWDAALNLPGI